MPSCHSTNEILMELIKLGNVEDGMIVVTDEQTAGKGQRGNKWFSEPHKNLTFSIAIDVSFLNISQIFNLNMAVCLGITKVLKDLDHSLSIFYKIKWPNDIYFRDNKIGGILIETVFKADKSLWAVIGIGLNVNQTDFGRLNANSLKNIHLRDFDLAELLEKLALSIESNMEQKSLVDFNYLKFNYLTHLHRFEILAEFKNINGVDFVGIIKGVEDTGKIAIESEGKLRYYDKQEVKFVR
ncbi:MAG: biotin--[acetyl-CoA-carboxylase] ligase [Cytophagales bacterium]